MTKIMPTVGRVVLYNPYPDDPGGTVPGGKQAAIVAQVHGDTCVNLCVISPEGNTYNRTSVRLYQPGEEVQQSHGYCEWMAYQAGQAAKTEQMQQLTDERIREIVRQEIRLTEQSARNAPKGNFAPRHVTRHKIEGVDSLIDILVLDEPGPGGAHHHYLIEGIKGPLDHHPIQPVEIKFQKGPLAEEGANGITIEALLAVCIDRLECFQKGPFPCMENAHALDFLVSAIDMLHARTKGRILRGVEGKTEK